MLCLPLDRLCQRSSISGVGWPSYSVTGPEKLNSFPKPLGWIILVSYSIASSAQAEQVMSAIDRKGVWETSYEAPAGVALGRFAVAYVHSEGAGRRADRV